MLLPLPPSCCELGYSSNNSACSNFLFCSCIITLKISNLSKVIKVRIMVFTAESRGPRSGLCSLCFKAVMNSSGEEPNEDNTPSNKPSTVSRKSRNTSCWPRPCSPSMTANMAQCPLINVFITCFHSAPRKKFSTASITNERSSSVAVLYLPPALPICWFKELAATCSACVARTRCVECDALDLPHMEQTVLVWGLRKVQVSHDHSEVDIIGRKLRRIRLEGACSIHFDRGPLPEDFEFDRRLTHRHIATPSSCRSLN